MNIQVNISLCRVCMKSEIGKSMLEDELLQTKFEFVTNLRVQQGDNLPALICEKCILLLNVSNKFIQIAHETEKSLKTFLAKIKNDFKLVTKSATEANDGVESDEVIEILEFIGATDTQPSLEKPAFSKKQSPFKSQNHKSKAVEYDNKSEVISNQKEENAEETVSNEITPSKNNIEVEACLLSTDDSNSQQLLCLKNDTESLVDFQDATDIPKSGNELMDLDAILITNDETVHLNEHPVNEQPLKDVVYTAEYEALLEDDSASMDIILYEDEEPSAIQTNEDSTFENRSTKDENTISTGSDMEKEDATDMESGTKSPAKQSISKKPAAALDAESRRFYCTQCKRDFSTKTNLTRHLALHDGKRPFQCEICSKDFSQNGTLKQHMLTHTGEKPHVCKICKRGFTQTKSLVFHMRRHSGDKPHQCDYCGGFFRQKDALKVHILKHHVDANERFFSCKICKKEIAVQALRNHMKSHLNNHKVDEQARDIIQMMDVTSLLNDSFLYNDDSLQLEGSTHVIDVMATSTTEPSRAKKYQCRKCFKCFAIKKNLVHHLSFHDAESTESHQCESCNLSFDTTEALKSHSAEIHEKSALANENECNKCGMKFTNSVDLEIHVKYVHTFECSHCTGLSFATQKLLNDHLIEHNMKILL